MSQPNQVQSLFSAIFSLVRGANWEPDRNVMMLRKDHVDYCILTTSSVKDPACQAAYDLILKFSSRLIDLMGEIDPSFDNKVIESCGFGSPSAKFEYFDQSQGIIYRMGVVSGGAFFIIDRDPDIDT